MLWCIVSRSKKTSNIFLSQCSILRKGFIKMTLIGLLPWKLMLTLCIPCCLLKERCNLQKNAIKVDVYFVAMGEKRTGPFSFALTSYRGSTNLYEHNDEVQ
jgi:hypothetical protein